MNLALPALIILLGLLPGIACFYGYFAGRFDKRTAGVSGVEQLALFVIFAVPIDVVALMVLDCVGIVFDFDVASHMLIGNVSDAAVHTEIVEFFDTSTVVSAVTFSVVLLAAFVLGSGLRRFVWACRLDTKIPYLRLKHEWFYILQGRLKVLPRTVLGYVDVMTRLPDKDGSQTRLFRGLVIDFELSASGTLDSITLTNAVRGSGRGDDFKWKPIPSSRLLIMGSTIHSINITYFAVDQPAQSNTYHGKFIAWLKSFALEDP